MLTGAPIADCLRVVLLLRRGTLFPQSFTHSFLLVVDPAWFQTSSDSGVRGRSIHSRCVPSQYIDGLIDRALDLG